MTEEMARADEPIDPRLMTEKKALLLAVEVLSGEAANERGKFLSDKEENLDLHIARCGELARAAGYLGAMAREPAKRQGDTHMWNIDARGAQDPAATEAAVRSSIAKAAPMIAKAAMEGTHESRLRRPALPPFPSLSGMLAQSYSERCMRKRGRKDRLLKPFRAIRRMLRTAAVKGVSQ